jgi:hypothetical protein
MKQCRRKLPNFSCTNLVGSLNEGTLRLLNSLKLVNQGVQNDTNKVCLRVRPASPIDYLQKLGRIVSRHYSLYSLLDVADFWFQLGMAHV